MHPVRLLNTLMSALKIKKSIDKTVKKVTEKRHILGLSQKDLADKIGVNRIAIINLEKNRTHLRYDKMLLLLNELRLS